MDYVVFSHLRWDFVYQRPQHLLTRCARENRVFFWEEPVASQSGQPSLRVEGRERNLTVAVPELPAGLTEQQAWQLQEMLLLKMLHEHRVHEFVSWYYSPMAVRFTDNLSPIATVYDCMDELSAFRGAPPGLTRAESELFEWADLVFTGGKSLYETKRHRHHSVHLFPSSTDFKHFAQARSAPQAAADQASIPHPRFGYCGVIDERMDTALLRSIAEMHPEWHFVMVGPVVKISEAELPRGANIHYLGAKTYRELPAYIAGWDAAMMPFAMNESTRFISPTKTPEYLAAGRSVVSTPITDVASPYGELGLVAIAATPKEFASALRETLSKRTEAEQRVWLKQVDTFLAHSSWDSTWQRMSALVHAAARQRSATAISGTSATADRSGISTD